MNKTMMVLRAEGNDLHVAAMNRTPPVKVPALVTAVTSAIERNFDGVSVVLGAGVSLVAANGVLSWSEVKPPQTVAHRAKVSPPVGTSVLAACLRALDASGYASARFVFDAVSLFVVAGEHDEFVRLLA